MAPSAKSPRSLHVGDLEISPDRHIATVAHIPLHLTKSEFAILQTLALQAGRAVARSDIKRALGEDYSARALESHISRLRLKLRNAGTANVITPVRHRGYRLEAR
ncbi:winged helix-turn-helix domain-containing protein [Serinicoccus chungangensis]|uniref:winged helix-turn-helix domain-containing protein n=1 Tax=Serinicoccus chungangensis TaxID=767452 RepID=UPI003AF32366